MAFQRLSGFAAIGAGITYLIGFWVFLSLLGPAAYGSPHVPPAQHVQFLIDHQDLMIAWNHVIYILNAVLMVFIVIGLHQRINAGNQALAQTAAAFGLIWAGLILAAGMVENIGISQIVRLSANDMDAATALWQSTIVIGTGLGGGNEITGGMWILLISGIGLQTKSFPTAINAMGLLVGGAGVISTIPPLSDATVVFGLGFIVWFFAIGTIQILAHHKVTAQNIG